MSDRKDVAFIAPGVNSKRYVRECMESLQKCDWGNYTYEIIYCDNGSTDGTLEMMAEEFPEVIVLANGKNLGYCVACNLGARQANSRYYFFANDDIVVPDLAIPKLIEHMDQHEDVATVGARLVFPDGSEQWSGRLFPGIASSIFSRRGRLTRIFPNLHTVREYLCKDGVEKGEPFEVDWVSAAGQLVRPEHFWKVGGFAEDYYYWHEMVLCHRLKQKGYKVILHPQSIIVHYEGFGSGPRSFSRERFHIIDFHRGAYRAYNEINALSSFSPASIFAACTLTGRASVLFTAAALRAAVRSVRPTGAAS